MCIGEPLALVAGDRLDGPLAGDEVQLAGAEANVAVGLAAYGVEVDIVARLGDDVAGRVIRAGLAGRGVGVGALVVDATRPTGRYAKVEGVDDAGEPKTTSRYRRFDSAMAAAGPGLLGEPAVRDVLAGTALVHCSGITPALSADCAALMEALLVERGLDGGGRPGPHLSFDVNWREPLWPDGDTSVVARLADHADTVLVGADEAERVFGESDPGRLRRLLPGPELLVVKDGARRAVALPRDGDVVEVPALAVDVVEPVGAGDSFAAGFLYGRLLGEPLRRCLRRGHLGAAATLTVRGDFRRPDPSLINALIDADDADWAAARVTASGQCPKPVALRSDATNIVGEAPSGTGSGHGKPPP